MRNLKSIVIFTLLLFSSIPVLADDYIYTGSWSYHFDQKDHPISNENHELIGYQHNSWMVGSYKNSWGDQSYIIGREFSIKQYGNFKFSALVGADYGYMSCDTPPEHTEPPKWCPAILPTVTYVKYDVQPSLAIMGRALTFQIRWKFN